MASSSSGAGIPPDYGTLSNASTQVSTSNTETLKKPTVAQVPRLPPIQNSSEPTVNRIFALLGAASLMPWNGILSSHSILGLSPDSERDPAMITALPYFVSRMGDSPLKNTYASSFVLTYQSVRWPTLIHATLTTSSVRLRDVGMART